MTEKTEELVTSANLEIDAMTTQLLGRLGLETTRQLGQLLASDPQQVTKLLLTNQIENND